ncbi:uncharacterized protein [Eleutherodactylus coqui]|uniref:uncharacterized protein n=1 Tax=Eleutherodactylus coqui TaxID=57060 RepID=UPI003462B2AA
MSRNPWMSHILWCDVCYIGSCRANIPQRVCSWRWRELEFASVLLRVRMVKEVEEFVEEVEEFVEEDEEDLAWKERVKAAVNVFRAWGFRRVVRCPRLRTIIEVDEEGDEVDEEEEEEDSEEEDTAGRVNGLRRLNNFGFDNIMEEDDEEDEEEEWEEELEATDGGAIGVLTPNIKLAWPSQDIKSEQHQVKLAWASEESIIVLRPNLNLPLPSQDKKLQEHQVKQAWASEESLITRRRRWWRPKWFTKERKKDENTKSSSHIKGGKLARFFRAVFCCTVKTLD